LEPPAITAYTASGETIQRASCPTLPGLPSVPDSIRTLDYVILLCDNLAAMRAFYEQRLGLPVVRDWENWLELGAGAVRLTLRPRGRPYDGPRVSPGAGVQLAFRVPPGEVAAWQAALEAAGVEVLEGARDQAYGHRTLFVRDPEGNVVEIYADI
jgi:catechol 2,3-dioxygenase-like lactoylglutathione lyase family enzyme